MTDDKQQTFGTGQKNDKKQDREHEHAVCGIHVRQLC